MAETTTREGHEMASAWDFNGMRTEDGFHYFTGEEVRRMVDTFIEHRFSVLELDKATWDIDEDDKGSWFDSLHIELTNKEGR